MGTIQKSASDCGILGGCLKWGALMRDTFMPWRALRMKLGALELRDRLLTAKGMGIAVVSSSALALIDRRNHDVMVKKKGLLADSLSGF